MGIAFLWHTARRDRDDRAPDTVPEALTVDSPHSDKEPATT
jgi:hypothetical protein